MDSNKLVGAYACPKRKKSQEVLRRAYNPMQYVSVIAVKAVEEALKGKVGPALNDYIGDELKKLPYTFFKQWSYDYDSISYMVDRYIKKERRKYQKPSPAAKTVHFTSSKEEISVFSNAVFMDKEEVDGEIVPSISTVSYKVKGYPYVKYRGRTPDTDVKQNSEIYSLILASIEEGRKQGISHFLAVGEIIYLKKEKDDILVSESADELSPFESTKQVVKNGLLVSITNAGVIFHDLDAAMKYEKAVRSFIDGREPTQTACQSCEMHSKCFFKEAPIGVMEEKGKSNISAFSFSEDQKKIITAEDGVFRVIAGAGAGKTTVTVVRVASLIAKGADASRILVITFTTSAVKAFREKLVEYLTDYGLSAEADKVKITTFNGFGMDLVKRFYRELGFSKLPMVLESVDQYDLMTDALTTYNTSIIGEDYRFPLMHMKNCTGVIPAMLDYVAEIKKSLDLPTVESLQALFGFGPEKSKQILEVVQIYNQECRDKGMLDYADQIGCVFKILEVFPNLFEEEGFEHIIVDEFQDTNGNNLLLTQEIANTSHFKSLMVVGDDLQAIYGFQGGDVENFIDFYDLIGMQGQDFYLTDNYRSSEGIVNVANSIAAKIVNKIPKTMNTNQVLGEIPELIGFNSDKEETAAIAGLIKKKIEEGVNPSDICFIARKKTELTSMQSELTKLGVPVFVDVPVKFLDNSNVTAFIDFTECLLDGEGNVGVFNYLNAISGNTLELDEGAAIVKNTDDFLKNEFVLLPDEEKKQYYLERLEALNNGDSVYASFVDTVKERSQHEDSLLNLMNYVVKYKRYAASNEARIEGSFNAVNLTTFHSSKGLEWKHVFMSVSKLDSANEYFPTDKEKDDIWRLIFVGATRAQKSLVISSIKSYTSMRNRITHRWYDELSKMDCFSKREDIVA